MMQIVDGRSPGAIMNAHRSLQSQPIGNKEKNNLPITRIRNIKNALFKIYNVFSHLLSTFMI
jgi:hypothetical protein